MCLRPLTKLRPRHCQTVVIVCLCHVTRTDATTERRVLLSVFTYLLLFWPLECCICVCVCVNVQTNDECTPTSLAVLLCVIVVFLFFLLFLIEHSCTLSELIVFIFFFWLFVVATLTSVASTKVCGKKQKKKSPSRPFVLDGTEEEFGSKTDVIFSAFS